jgi:hypothetical protein
MAIEIVDLPIKHGDLIMLVYQRVTLDYKQDMISFDIIM